MVAKGFLAAAAIIICCSTTLQGKDPEEKCASGDCPGTCSDKEQCSAKEACCADGECDDKEECCEKKQVSLETCVKEKCSGEKCSTSECAKSKCSTEKGAASTCAEGDCTAGKCSGETCASLKCALTACAKTACSIDSSCSDATCDAAPGGEQECAAGGCPLAACSTEVCASLKCAVEACLTAVDAKDECGETTCSSEKRATSKCASTKCSKEICATSACSTATCSTGKCSTESCSAAKSEVSSCADGKCAAEVCATEKCASRECSTSACGATKCVVTERIVRIADEDRAVQEEMLASKLVELDRLQREVDMLRRLLDVNSASEISQTAYEDALVALVKEPECVTKVYPVPDLQVWKIRPQGAEFDADLLVAHIKATVAPQSWRGAVCSSPAKGEAAEGAIEAFERNGSLVICQTEENHELISGLLREMRVADEQEKGARKVEEAREAAKPDAKVEAAGVELELVRKLIVLPASAEEPAGCGSKCGKANRSQPEQGAGNSLEFGTRFVDLPLTPAELPWEVRIDVDFTSEEFEDHDVDGRESTCPCIGGECMR